MSIKKFKKKFLSKKSKINFYLKIVKINLFRKIVKINLFLKIVKKILIIKRSNLFIKIYNLNNFKYNIIFQINSKNNMEDMNLKNILNNFPKRDSIIVLKIFR